VSGDIHQDLTEEGRDLYMTALSVIAEQDRLEWLLGKLNGLVGRPIRLIKVVDQAVLETLTDGSRLLRLPPTKEGSSGAGLTVVNTMLQVHGLSLFLDTRHNPALAVLVTGDIGLTNESPRKA
jgi:hypothetical protein